MNKEAACAVDCSDWRLSLFLILSSSLPFFVSLSGLSYTEEERLPDEIEKWNWREVPFHLIK